MAASSKSKPNLWEKVLSKLPKEKQNALRSGLGSPRSFKAEALTAVVTQAQQRALSKRWKIKSHHGEVAIRDVFDKIVLWVKKCIAIGDSAVVYDPAHAALPWAALRLVLQVFVNDSSRAAEFAKGLERVALYIYDCALRETLYLKESHGLQKQLERNIVRLYTTILDFMHGAKSVVKSEDEVISLLQPAAQQASDVVITSGLIDTQIQSESFTDIKDISESLVRSHAWLRQQLEETEKIVGILVSNHKETNLRFDTIDGCAKQNQRLQILQWLSLVPYREHHQKELNELLESTGLWFLESQIYRSWKYSHETAMLWLHGAPGTGKGKLMSLALQSTLEECGVEVPALYFYCSRTAAEPERACAEDILRCLVKELSTGNIGHETDQVPEYVAQKYQAAESIGFASGKLTVAECRKIVAKFASNHQKLYIFLDALDELEEPVQHDLVKSLRIITTGVPESHVKILISSRDNTNVASLFPQNKTYDLGINNGENQNDIDSYVKTQLADLIEQGQIDVKGKPPSQKLQQDIVMSLCTKSQGMFRWVSLQLDYLSTLHTEADITSRLGRLPRKLSDSYEEIWATRTQSYEAEDMVRLDLALSLLLIPNTPTPAIFARFIFGDDNDDEHEDGIDTKGTTGQILVGGDLGRPLDRTAEQNDPLLEMIMRLCFGLVIFDTTTNSFRFAHLSVQEYILSRKDGYESFSQSYARIAQRCMSVLIEPGSVIDNVRPYTNRILWAEEGVKKRSSTIFPKGCYFDVSLDNNTTDWISRFWAYYVAKSKEIRQTPVIKDLEAVLQESVNRTSWESLNPSVFFSACQFGNLQFVQKWLSHHPRLALLKQCEGDNMTATALHFAASGDDPDIVACLLDAGAESDAQAGPKKSSTPLHFAIAKGSLRVVRSLLQNEGRADVIDMNPYDGSTFGSALGLAMIKGTEEIIHALLDHATPLSYVGPEGLTPFSKAVDSISLRFLRLMLDRGVIAPRQYIELLVRLPNSAWTDDDGSTRLLLDAGDNPRAMGQMVISPLGVATTLNQKAVEEMIFDPGVVFNDPVHVNGKTSLHTAVHTGNEELMELLLAAGADPNITAVDGSTALISAATTGSLKAIERLLPLTTNLNIQTLESETALSIAAKNGHQAIVEALLDAGAEVEPTESGPHCSFLDPSERINDFGRCACASALQSGDDATFRAIMGFLAQKEPQSVCAEVLRSLDVVGWDSFDVKATVQALGEILIQWGVCRSEDEENILLPLLMRLVASAKNPFGKFAGMMLLRRSFKQGLNLEFSKHMSARARVFMIERKKKVMEEFEEIKLRHQKEIGM